jgi:hypothetical protein
MTTPCKLLLPRLVECPDHQNQIARSNLTRLSHVNNMDANDVACKFLLLKSCTQEVNECLLFRADHHGVINISEFACRLSWTFSAAYKWLFEIALSG